ncbi:MAG: radical SAM protein [Nanoarchaeota archaeon]
MTKHNVVFFCVTDFCNAGCKSCSFWETKNPKFPKKKDLPKIVDVIHSKLDCGFLEITGGEPLTYPFVYDLIHLASKKGMITQLMTNGSLLNNEVIKKLCSAGLNMLAISIDHWNDKIMDDYRQIPGLSAKIGGMAKELKKTDLIIQAGIGINTYNINDLEKTARHAISIGFDELYFCWPVKSTGSTYKLGNKNYDVTQISDEQISDAIQVVLGLKRTFGHKIAHKYEHLRDMLKYYKKSNQKCTCKGGQNLFYLDNHLDVYRCMTLPDKLGSIHGKVKTIKNAKCEKCSLQCFREGSLYFLGVKSAPVCQLIHGSGEPPVNRPDGMIPSQINTHSASFDAC